MLKEPFICGCLTLPPKGLSHYKISYQIKKIPKRPQWPRKEALMSNDSVAKRHIIKEKESMLQLAEALLFQGSGIIVHSCQQHHST